MSARIEEEKALKDLANTTLQLFEILNSTPNEAEETRRQMDNLPRQFLEIFENDPQCILILIFIQCKLQTINIFIFLL